MNALIVPVYGNAEGIAALVDAVRGIAARCPDGFEAVFVVDGSPDDSWARLAAALPRAGFASRLIALSRNFGAFAAIREGLRHARGERFAVMAADLQEPPELIDEFFRVLREEPVDVVLGTRESRADPWPDRMASALFWRAYRRFVQPQIPPGGIDVFGCTARFREALLALEAVNTSLVGQLVWLGFRSRTVPYARRARTHGRSGWSLRKKLDYLLDSVFAFTDLPIKALLAVGAGGLVLSALLAALVLVDRLANTAMVPGYAATALLILFFSALNLFALGIVGSYAWRAFELAKGRPAALVLRHDDYDGMGS